MNKYKTVKEMCALTGLTRKHLYYFHHEKVVQAAAYANYSVAGYDGYKLYDMPPWKSCSRLPCIISWGSSVTKSRS